jgi:hypothetical protein
MFDGSRMTEDSSPCLTRGVLAYIGIIVEISISSLMVGGTWRSMVLDLPKSPTGKVLGRVLREAYE